MGQFVADQVSGLREVRARVSSFWVIRFNILHHLACFFSLLVIRRRQINTAFLLSCEIDAITLYRIGITTSTNIEWTISPLGGLCELRLLKLRDSTFTLYGLAIERDS